MYKTCLLALCLFADIASATALVQRQDQMMMLGQIIGSQKVSIDAQGSGKAEYQFNDRGRGDHTQSSWKLDANGIPLEYTVRGNNYLLAPVAETFRLRDGKAVWKSLSEHGEKIVSAPAFYYPGDAPPEMAGVLARALLKAPDHRLALLPAGEARIETVSSLRIDAAHGPVELTLYRIIGLDFVPQSIWLEADGTTAATLSGWGSMMPAIYAGAANQLLSTQEAAEGVRSARLAKELTHTPTGALLIRNARLYDPRDLSVSAGTSVLVQGERVIRIAPDAELATPADAEVIDAHGRFLMPGLWDVHKHYADADGPLDIAAGITSARDLANDIESFPKRVARFDAGTEIGPRVLMAGIIDSSGPFAGPTKMLVDTPEQALKAVDWYADHGYMQIKLYSSLKPELVAIMADRAHARGLRVSGHVPAHMSAHTFVQAGADEIQHFNFIVLDLLYPRVQETRDTHRFTEVAEHAREFTPDRPEVRELIAFLVRHHTVLDPTINFFEDMFSGDPTTKVPPALKDVAARLPPQIQRNLSWGALVVPKGQETAYREAFPAMLRLLKAFHDGGVTLMPGTDSMAGYSLHYELMLYARAGIANAEVLRIATLTPAQVLGVDKERGVIAPGKLADMILINGDPLRDMADIRNIDMVFKGGKRFDPSEIEHALGIAPRGSAPVADARMPRGAGAFGVLAQQQAR